MKSFLDKIVELGLFLAWISLIILVLNRLFFVDVDSINKIDILTSSMIFMINILGIMAARIHYEISDNGILDTILKYLLIFGQINFLIVIICYVFFWV